MLDPSECLLQGDPSACLLQGDSSRDIPVRAELEEALPEKVAEGARPTGL